MPPRRDRHDRAKESDHPRRRSMRELCPSIWSNLPHDIIFNVLRFLDRPDLINWSCVSEEFVDFATAQVWRRLSFSSSFLELHSPSTSTSEDLESPPRQDRAAPAPAAGVLSPSDDDRRINMQYERLNHISTWRNRMRTRTSLPLIYTKELFVRDWKQPISIISEASLFRIGRALQVLLPQLLALVKVVYAGWLPNWTFHSILKVKNLRSLFLRIAPGDHNVIEGKRYHPGRTNLMLSLERLCVLKRLTTLRIDSIMICEVLGLAKAIRVLDLKILALSCGAATIHPESGEWASPSTYRAVSPLIPLFEHLLTHQEGDSPAASGLPRTLKFLMLIDQYHTAVSGIHHCIARAIEHCPDLETVAIFNFVNNNRLRAHMYSPIFGRGQGLTVQSWSQLCYDEDTRWIYEYRGRAKDIRWTSVLPDHSTRSMTNITRGLDDVASQEKRVKPSGNQVRAITFRRNQHLPRNAVLVSDFPRPRGRLLDYQIQSPKYIEDLTARLIALRIT